VISRSQEAFSADSPVVSLVIPLFCESGSLPKLLDAVYDALVPLSLDFECILVDDGSNDGTWETIVAEIEQRPGLRAFRLSRNFGKEAALACGLSQSRGEVSIVMDADFEHPPALLPKFIELWRSTGANVVEGIKEPSDHQLPARRLVNQVFFWLFRKSTGFELENHSDFKLIDRQVRETWLTFGEKALFFRGLVAWMGYTRVPLFFKVPTVSGRSSRWSTQQLVHLASGGITAFSSLPLHFVTISGVLFILFAIGLGLQTLYNWYTGIGVTGFSTVILLQLITGGLLMLSLGLIGVYISHIYVEVKGRPRFIVRETVSNR
jgi:glycosyltransferase involved in cell wall biosynthesis